MPQLHHLRVMQNVATCLLLRPTAANSLYNLTIYYLDYLAYLSFDIGF